MDNFNSSYDIAYLKNISKTMEPCAVRRKEQHFSLGIGLSSHCNFHCPMCYYHNDMGKAASQTHMPLPLLHKILIQLPVLANITVGLEGEPFCHPHIFQALDMMATKSDKLCIVSNGSLLTKNICRILAAYPITLFALSIDAAERAAYAKFRAGGSFQTFIKHGACLEEYLGDAVRLHTVIFAENLEHITMMPKVAAEMGIRHISFQQLRPHAAAQRRGITPSPSVALEICLTKIIENAIKYNILIHFENFFGSKAIMQMLHDVSKTTPNLRVQQPIGMQCANILNFTSILSDGRIFPCCGDFQPAEITSYSFDGIFNHDYLQCLRSLHRQGISLAPCAQCRQELTDC